VDEDQEGAPVIADAFAPIAVTDRSGVVESVHHGVVVALGSDGAVAWSVGDPNVVMYPRSALKPLQAAAMVAAGLELDDRLLALVCASHDGRSEHVAGVEAILAGVGLGPADLENTPTLPLDTEAHADAVRAGVGPSSILQNCSGKHAGMLATAVVNGWATVGYPRVDHPVQLAIVDHLRTTVGPIEHVGVDGCGAPAPTVSLIGLACAVRALAVGGHAVHRAMSSYPEMVGGPTRDVTNLMRLVPGLMVKDGAEGVQVAALPDGRAIALKVADGGGRARTPVTVAALRSLGVAVASDVLTEPILGHGQPVGSVRSLVGEP
jgi:L-asparaginase II